MRIKANMIRFWKKKKAWEFSQEVLEEGEEILYENPERGWYEIYTFPVEEKIDPQELKWSLHEQETLALVLLDLQKFREKPLDEQAIYNIKTILYFFASHKKDVILRPVYDREGKGLEAEPESSGKCWKKRSTVFLFFRAFWWEAGEKCIPRHI